MSWDYDYDHHRPHKDNTVDMSQVTYICLGIGGLVCFIVFCCCLCKRRQRNGIVRSTAPAPTAVAVVHTQSSNLVPQLNDGTGVYVVPFSALPANFDYSSPNVEVRGDHVILRDLGLLEAGNNPTINNNFPPPYSTTEAYQKQYPYNPGYNTNI